MQTLARRLRDADGHGLRRLNAFGASWMGVPVMPVDVPFLVSRGLRTGDVLDLQAIFSLAVMPFEIPTGLPCDLLGRRRTSILGASLNLGACPAPPPPTASRPMPRCSPSSPPVGASSPARTSR